MDSYIKKEICAKVFEHLTVHGDNEIFLRRLQNLLNQFPVVGDDKPVFYTGQKLNENRENIIPDEDQVNNMPRIIGEVFSDHGNLNDYTKTRWKV